MNANPKERSLQDIGRGAYECIAEMVAALECDYDRLAELRELRDTPSTNWSADTWTDEREELAELETAAGECESREDAETRISEDPLSIEVRGDWRAVGEAEDAGEGEFCILLGTGGPATRIRGELSGGEPARAWIEAQDWGTPWTHYFGADQDTLLTYARQFYFGG
jgi:hypothetical protein